MGEDSIASARAAGASAFAPESPPVDSSGHLQGRAWASVLPTASGGGLLAAGGGLLGFFPKRAQPPLESLGSSLHRRPHAKASPRIPAKHLHKCSNVISLCLHWPPLLVYWCSNSSPLEGAVRCERAMSLKRDTNNEWWRLAPFPPGSPVSDHWRGDVLPFDSLRWPGARCSRTVATVGVWISKRPPLA